MECPHCSRILKSKSGFGSHVQKCKDKIERAKIDEEKRKLKEKLEQERKNIAAKFNESDHDDCENFIIGCIIDYIDYDSCERIDIDFIKDYIKNVDEYSKSLDEFYYTQKGSNIMEYQPREPIDFDDLCEYGNNQGIIYRLTHWIKKYFKTNLSFYVGQTYPDGRIKDSGILYFGIRTDKNDVESINNIMKNFDMVTYKKVLDHLELCDNKVSIYENMFLM